MKLKNLTISMLFAATFSLQNAAQAEGTTTLAMEQMAEILLSLEAKPGSDAQLTLDDITKDNASTYNERLLAGTIKHLDKKIRAEDKPTMLKIWTSPAASESERELAKILLRFNDKPSDSTKAMLGQLLEQ